MPHWEYEKVLYGLFQALAFVGAAVFLFFWALKACIREYRDFKEWLYTSRDQRGHVYGRKRNR